MVKKYRLRIALTENYYYMDGLIRDGVNVELEEIPEVDGVNVELEEIPEVDGVNVELEEIPEVKGQTLAEKFAKFRGLNDTLFSDRERANIAKQHYMERFLKYTVKRGWMSEDVNRARKFIFEDDK